LFQKLALEKNSKGLGHHLKAIVTALVSMAQKPFQSAAISILHLLIQQEKLKDAILHLDPFPDMAIFMKINQVYLKYL